MPGLAVTAGKTFTDFQQIAAVYGGGHMLLLGAKYQIPELGWVNLQLGNKSDISFISGNCIIFPSTTTSGYVGGQKVSALGLDGYVTVGMMGFVSTNEFTAQALNLVSASQEYTCYAQLTYTMGAIALTVYRVTDVLKSFSNDPNTAIGIELPITIAKNFKILDPRRPVRLLLQPEVLGHGSVPLRLPAPGPTPREVGSLVTWQDASTRSTPQPRATGRFG
jgi:hypothetical protein